MKNRKGFILLLTLIFMTVLTVFTGSLIYMTSADMKNAAPQSDDVNMAGLADAGIDKAHRAMRDFFLTNTQTGTADLRGGSTAGSSGVTAPEHVMHIDGTGINNPTLAQLTPAIAVINNSINTALLRTFDSNYTNTKIVSVQVRARASRRTGGQGATLQVSYSTAANPSYTTLITQVLPSSRTLTEYSATLPSPGPSGWDWSTTTTGLMNPNLILRAMRTGANPNREIYLDAMYLRVTYEIDVPPANWATGAYTAFPINLYAGANDGQIEYARIGEGGNLGALYYEETSEQGKVHLNYASQSLLTNLLKELNITGESEKAQAIVDYRTGPPFHYFGSVEELKRVSGISQTDYDVIKNFVTVYSFANKNTQRLSGAGNYRAPVNINTAPRQVLEAIFDPLPIGSTDAASLATDIISARSTPFTCFYSFNTAVTTDFYDLVNTRGYLTTAEKQAIWDNADASLIPADATIVTGPNAVTTEFCYTGDVFKINSLANIHVTDAARTRRLRVNTMRGGIDGRRVLEIYDSGTPPVVSAGYRKENYE